jgi:hypothetical protein
MIRKHWILAISLSVMAIFLMFGTGCSQKETEPAEIETQEINPEETQELPAPVAEVVKTHFPDAQIDFVEVVDEAGITLYDIEFKENAGEIEVAEDGTIIDIVHIITMEDVPEAAAEVFKKIAEDAEIVRLEKSEIHSEIQTEGEASKLVKLETYKYVYEAELVKDGRTGEITVDAEGTIIEPLKWD